MNTEKYITNNEAETIAIGKAFAAKLQTGDVVAVNGDLGAGKTELIKGICDYFDVIDMVNSPTFTIMNHYTGTYNDEEINIIHIDLYRIETAKELTEIGFDECIHSEDYIKLIEWPQKAQDKLDNWNYKIIISTDEHSENKREISITSKD